MMATQSGEIVIRQVLPGELPAAVELLAYLNADTPVEILRERLETILRESPHYQLFGAFIGAQLFGVAGAWIATKVWCGKYLEIDNIVVDPNHRSSGIGGLMIAHLEEIARQNDCEIAVLDSYTANHASHRLYHRAGFHIGGFHFLKYPPHTGDATNR